MSCIDKSVTKSVLYKNNGANKPLRNIALKIAYQGKGFLGWQWQPNARTVEGEIRAALARLHKRSSLRDVVLYAAGRTDSGVHAIGQVANFYSDISSDSLPANKFCMAINSQLPNDVRILHSWEVSNNFHARYTACMRIYHYRIVQGQSCVPEQRQMAWYVRTPQLDTSILNCMLRPLLGEHDFSSFTVSRDQAKTKIRCIHAAYFYYQGPYIVFYIAGNAFLWHMVRIIVGTVTGLYSQYFTALVQSQSNNIYQELYAHRHSLREQVALCLARKQHSGFNAPAHGLTLSQVVYPEAFFSI